jgi:ABC-type transport system involved in multi-copper enzyme maturation permease subunit
MRTTIADRLALVRADLLKLRRRRGLAIISVVLTIGLVTISYAVLEALHASNPAKHLAPGGADKLGNAIFVLSMFAAVASALIGATTGSGDHDAGVYRDLVITGRSRLELYISRIPAGLAYLLPFTLAAYAILAAANLAFTGHHRSATPQLLILTGLWLLLEVAFYYLLALALACLTASRAYAIAIAIAWRLAATPLLATATTLGTLRDAIPGVAMENLAPTQITSSVQQGPPITISTIASITILIVWVAILLTGGAWRETTRDA